MEIIETKKSVKLFQNFGNVAKKISKNHYSELIYSIIFERMCIASGTVTICAFDCKLTCDNLEEIQFTRY